MSRSFSDRIDWPTRNAIRVTGRHTTTVVRANTTVLPHSTGSRLGTAVKLVRIRPVAYSPVTSSDQAVEGSERSLVHSERTTRAWLTRWVAEPGGRAGVAGWAAVMAGLPSGRGRGTRPRPGSCRRRPPPARPAGR